jgi:hypothetical protein
MRRPQLTKATQEIIKECSEVRVHYQILKLTVEFQDDVLDLLPEEANKVLKRIEALNKNVALQVGVISKMLPTIPSQSTVPNNLLAEQDKLHDVITSLVKWESMICDWLGRQDIKLKAAKPTLSGGN